jgi:hypothetical protein
VSINSFFGTTTKTGCHMALAVALLFVSFLVAHASAGVDFLFYQPSLAFDGGSRYANAVRGTLKNTVSHPQAWAKLTTPPPPQHLPA